MGNLHQDFYYDSQIYMKKQVEKIFSRNKSITKLFRNSIFIISDTVSFDGPEFMRSEEIPSNWNEDISLKDIRYLQVFILHY